MEIEVITEPIAALGRPFITFADDMMPFVEHDLDATKAGLLYADTVTLRSYLVDLARMAAIEADRGSMPLQAYAMTVRTVLDMSDAVMATYGIDPSTRPPRAEAQAAWNEYSRPLDDNENIGARIDRLAAFVDRYRDFDRAFFEKYLRRAHAFPSSLSYEPLRPAIEEGIVRLDGWTDTGPEFSEHEEVYIARAAEGLFGDLRDAIPMIDAGAEPWRAHVQAAQMSDVRAETATRLLARLPGFDRATVGEILDIRRELQGPLSRFRAFADELARGAPDSPGELTAYVDERWRSEVAPALAQLDEDVKQNTYLAELARHSVRSDNFIPTLASVAVGFGALSGITSYLTAAAGVAVVPLRALIEARSHSREVQKHRLYLLHRFSK